MQNKRGVSPLIATVLLIAFAVALGAVVMSWGRGYVNEQAKGVSESSDRDITCTTDVRLDWYERSRTKQVCFGDGFVWFMIENGPVKDIVDLRLIIDGDKDVFTNESILNQTFAKADIKRFNISYDNATYGAVRQINIYPTVDINGNRVICSGQALVQVSPQACD
ncbi:MAG: archaellin/type IV pilin N-terminal domain-containing protein [Nanoarchaeota archaeon]